MSLSMTYVYEGGELELFAEARNWKAYLGHILRPFIRGRVLEVGAGFGSNIPFLHNPSVAEWTALEPDAGLAARLSGRIAAGELPAYCRALIGTLPSMAGRDGGFDAILYIDVLEHIADDKGETAAAQSLLAPGGHLIVVSPAHPFLYCAFDAAIGHVRRYTRASLRAAGPPGGALVMLRLLDCAGFFASLGNRLLLNSATPKPGQILLWDRRLVPLSRRLDRLIGWRFGKSVAGVWRAPDAG
jgi:SAM-dependent methyltransferase